MLFRSGAGNHQRRQQTGNSQPMGGRTRCSGPYPRRRDVSPDPCRPAVVAQSAHRHSPQQPGRSCRARAAKVAECGRGTGLNGRHRAKSQSEPTLSVQGTPQFYHPMVRHRRADGSRLFVALAVDWFKSDGENGKAGDAPKLTKMVARAWSAATAKRFEVTAAIFSPPGCGCAYPTTAARRRPNWLGN